MVAFFVAGFTGVIIDYLVLKPLRKRNAPHLIPMIATIGVGIILNNGAQSIFGASNLRFPHGTVPEEVIEVAGLHLTVIELGIIFLSFALMAVLFSICTLRSRAVPPRRASMAPPEALPLPLSSRTPSSSSTPSSCTKKWRA